MFCIKIYRYADKEKNKIILYCNEQEQETYNYRKDVDGAGNNEEFWYTYDEDGNIDYTLNKSFVLIMNTAIGGSGTGFTNEVALSANFDNCELDIEYITSSRENII